MGDSSSDLALGGPKGTEAAGKPQLLVSIYPPDQSLDRPVAGKHWKATPATRMMELLHTSDIPLGLVTNGEHGCWSSLLEAKRLASLPGTALFGSKSQSLSSVSFPAFNKPLLRSSRNRDSFRPMKESAQDQQEVTNQLGDQVRDAVEVLIRAFDRLDEGSGRTLLKGVEEKSLYDAALTVMMRLVFLFSAEERGLLHLGRPIYDNNYAVSTCESSCRKLPIGTAKKCWNGGSTHGRVSFPVFAQFTAGAASRFAPTGLRWLSFRP